MECGVSTDSVRMILLPKPVQNLITSGENNKMQARGRNGWFDVKDIAVFNTLYWKTQEKVIRLEFTSKNIAQTREAPVIINALPHEIISLCLRILEKCNSFEAEILKAAHGDVLEKINKGE